MIRQTLRKEGEEYVVTIPNEEVERLGLREGQDVTVQVQPSGDRREMSPDVREAFEESWREDEHAYRYLAASDEMTPEVREAFERSWARNEQGYRYLADR